MHKGVEMIVIYCMLSVSHGRFICCQRISAERPFHQGSSYSVMQIFDLP